MNLNEKNLELQVQIWALIGPVIALATVITLYFQGASQNVMLSLAVLLGMLACWWWKTKGLIGALVGITLLGSYQFLNQQTDEPLWNIGITFAIALTFLVTALSFEEVEAIVGGIQGESASRLKNLLKLDEKLERVQSKLQEEKKILLNIVKEREQEIHHQEKLIELSREEIITSHRRHEELLTEIFTLKMEHEKEKEANFTAPASAEALKEIEELRMELTQSQDQSIIESAQARRELEQLRSELYLTKQQLQDKNSSENNLQAELLRTKNQLIAQTDESGYAQIEIDGLREELAQANEKLRNALQQAQTEQEKFKNDLTRHSDNTSQEINILKNLTSTLQEKLNIKTQEMAAKEDERIATQEYLQSELARISKEFSEQSAKDKSEMEALKAQLEAAATVNIAEAESRELRRIDGLYKQLRLQFEEKSNLLDATRRELFHTQEKLTRELMEQRERQYEGSEYERELQRCLDQLEDEQRELTDSHRREVEQLQDLISQMMCCT